MRGLWLAALIALMGCSSGELSRDPRSQRGSASSTGGSGSSGSSGTGSSSGSSGSSTGSGGTTGISTQASVTVVGGYTGTAFPSLRDLAFDGSGNLYATDVNDQLVIKVIAQTGAAWAGTSGGPCGTVDAQGPNAAFCLPTGMVWNGAVLLVADQGENNQDARIRAIDTAGNVSTVCGTGTYDHSTSGPCSSAMLGGPTGLAVDGAGNVYVAESGGAISRISADLQNVTVLAISPDVTTPFGLAVDAAGNVLIADYGTELIRELTPSGQVGVFAVLPIGFHGNANPVGVAIDPAGNVYGSDPTNGRIFRWSPDGGLTGQYEMDPSTHQPMGLKFENGALYAADAVSNQIYSVVFQ